MRQSRFLFHALSLGALWVPALGQQFQEVPGLLPAPHQWSEGVTASDVDQDGDLDLFFAEGDGFSSAGAKRQHRLLINQFVPTGVLAFTDESVARLGARLSHAKDCLVGDVDGDGWVDVLYVNAFNSDPPQLYLNQGAANPGFFTFRTAPQSGFAQAYSSAGGQFGDLDDDGDLDLILCDSGPSHLGGPGGKPHLFFNDGTGKFTESAAQLPAATKVAHMDVQLADVDGDWDLDFLGFNRASAGQGGHYLMLNDGAGTFSDASNLMPTASGSTYEGEVGDLDGDQDLDLFLVSLSGFREGHVENRLAPTGTLGFAAGPAQSLSQDDNEIVLLDYDVDGALDVVVGSLGSQERFYRNTGNLTWLREDARITAIGDSTLDATAADLDNDGRIDLVTAQGESGGFTNRVYRNTGAADTLAPRLTGLRGPQSVLPNGPWIAHVTVCDQVIDDGENFVTAEAYYVAASDPIGATPIIDYGPTGFAPQGIQIAAGTSVIFRNVGGAVDPLSSATPPYAWNVPLAPGQLYEHVFVRPGTYLVQNGTGQQGMIVVTGAAARVDATRSGGGLYRFSMTDTAGGAADYLVYEVWLRDRAGNTRVSSVQVEVLLDCTPKTYCTAKTNSLGCVPAIGSTGTPSITAGSGFTVRATNVRNNKPGLLFYGFDGPLSAPFQGGTLCVKTPVYRSPVVTTGGTPQPAQDCSGVFAIDVNAFAAGALGGHPRPELTYLGIDVNAQWWGRDQGFPAPQNTTLSNGIAFTMCL